MVAKSGHCDLAHCFCSPVGEGIAVRLSCQRACHFLAAGGAGHGLERQSIVPFIIPLIVLR